MPTININVTGKIAAAEQGCVVDNNLDYTVAFTFSEEWGGIAKVMRVNYKDGHQEVEIVDDAAELPGIPYGVRVIAIGVYAEDIATTTAAYLPVMPSIKNDVPEVEPDDPDTEGVPEGGTAGQYMTRNINGGLVWANLPAASSNKAGGVKADSVTANDTQPVRVGSDGKLYTRPGEPGVPDGGTRGQVLTKESSTDQDIAWADPEAYTLQVAGPTVLGGVQPSAKTNDMTQAVGVDAQGALWTEPGATYTLPVAGASTRGGVKAETAQQGDTQPVRIGADEKLYTAPGHSVPAGGTSGQVLTKSSATDYDAAWATPAAYSLPVASASQLGGVQPTAKTNAMTQAVGVDGSGALWTAPPTAELPSVSSSNNNAILQVLNGVWAIGIKILPISESVYNALNPKDPNTLYVVMEDQA